MPYNRESQVARSKAKTEILKWYDRGQPTQSERVRFSKDIDLFFDTISQREHWNESLSTLLEDEGKACFAIRGKTWSADPTANGLVVTSVVPGWSFGWRGVFDDEMSEDFFSWLGHYCRQYVHRSNICKVLMASWERDEIILHPFGSGSSFKRYPGLTTAGSPTEILAAAKLGVAHSWGPLLVNPTVYRSRWTGRNTLDPYIHQGISHFLRAQRLLKAGFEIEALVAMDCVIQSLQGMDWSWASGNPRRERRDLCRALDFGAASQDVSEEVYFLRNQFGAHAGGWRWWDTGEYLEDEICERASRLSNRLLRKASDIEKHHRIFDPDPENWATWLEESFDGIWNAVWFRDPT